MSELRFGGKRKQFWVVLILPDIHYPLHDRAALSAIEKLMPDLSPDYLVYLGDAVDCTPISHWLKDRRRPLEGLRIKYDLEGFRSVLERHRQLCKEPYVVYVKGNHDGLWIKNMIDQDPNFEGYLELESNFGELVDKFVEYDSYWKLGKLYFIHGHWTNKHNAHKHVISYHRSIVYGHAHTLQCFSENTPYWDDAHTAYCIGSLMDPSKAEYMHGMPSYFVTGFAIAYVHKETGNFNLFPVVVSNGMFIWNSRVYKGNDVSE